MKAKNGAGSGKKPMIDSIRNSKFIVDEQRGSSQKGKRGKATEVSGNPFFANDSMDKNTVGSRSVGPSKRKSKSKSKSKIKGKK